MNRYNPKVIHRKLKASDDWAEVIRYQSELAQKMIQEEKLQRKNMQADLKYD